MSTKKGEMKEKEHFYNERKNIVFWWENLEQLKNVLSESEKKTQTKK